MCDKAKAETPMPEMPIGEVITVKGITLCDTADQMMHIVKTEIDEGVDAAIAVFLDYNKQLNARGKPSCGSISNFLQVMPMEVLLKFESDITGKTTPAIIFRFIGADQENYVGYLLWEPINKEQDGGGTI